GREDEIRQLRERLMALEHEVSARQQRGLELKAEAGRHESRIQYNEERLRELESQNSRALAEIAQAGERCHAAGEELAVVAGNLSGSEAALAAHRDALEKRQAALADVENRLKDTQEQLRQAQSAAFTAAQDLTRIRNEMTALELQKQGNAVRLEKLSAEKAQLEEERALLDARLGEFTMSVEAEKLNAQARREAVTQRQERLRQVQEELARSSVEQDEMLQQQAAKRSRLSVIEQLERSREGFDAGAVAALRSRDAGRAVIGSLADHIRVPERFVVAMENALGHHLQLVLTEQPESAQEILADLNANKAGRASVAALAMQRPADEKQLAFEGEMAPGAQTGGEALPAGGIVHALSVVQSDPSVEKLLKSLLGRTFIASDLATATAQIQNGHAGCDFVTLSGDLLSRHGVYTGGYLNGHGNPKAPASILGRKNQISELESELAEMQQRVAEASRNRGALQAEQTGLQAGLQEAQGELREQEVAIATREGEFRALQNSSRLLAQKIETVLFEVQSLAAQEKEGMQKRDSLLRQLAEFEARERESRERTSALTAGVESLRAARETANAALTESRVALAAEEQLLASFRRQQEALGRRIEELNQLAAQRRGEIEAVVARREQAGLEIQESRQQMERLAHEHEQVNALAAELIGQKNSQESDIACREEQLRSQRGGLTELQNRRGAVEVELARNNMSVQNLRDRIQQKYHVQLDDVRSECITITFADEGPARVQTLTPEEMAASGAATDWDAVVRQIEALQQRLDEIGPVNLVAIEEYEETEQRYQFLSKQHDDLVSAKAQLL
ncbi:MAG: chromosome segregation protein SMC, partial [Verrucomicrobia bacterium]|nr:chromosome segregation protein SMC [Verrucomicrobiota bacterium]